MRFNLPNNLFVEVEDGYNYVLKQISIVGNGKGRGRKPKKERIGEEAEKTLGYHPTFEGAIKHAIRMGLCHENNIEDAFRFIQEIKNAIEAAKEITKKVRK